MLSDLYKTPVDEHVNALQRHDSQSDLEHRFAFIRCYGTDNSKGVAVPPPSRSSERRSFRARSELAGCFSAANNSENSGDSARRLGLGRCGARLLRAIGTGQDAAAYGWHVAIVDPLGVGGLVGEALFEGLGLLRIRRRHRGN